MVRKVLIIAVFLLLPLSVLAQSSADESAHQIYGEVMSPFCPGRLLQDCPSSSARELKEKIKADLVAGKSKESIVEGIYQTFGEQLRAEPKISGFGIMAWAMPAVFLLVGLAVWTIWLKRSNRNGSAEISPAEARSSSEISAEMKARIENELSK